MTKKIHCITAYPISSLMSCSIFICEKDATWQLYAILEDKQVIRRVSCDEHLESNFCLLRAGVEDCRLKQVLTDIA